MNLKDFQTKLDNSKRFYETAKIEVKSPFEVSRLINGEMTDFRFQIIKEVLIETKNDNPEAKQLAGAMLDYLEWFDGDCPFI